MDNQLLNAIFCSSFATTQLPMDGNQVKMVQSLAHNKYRFVQYEKEMEWMKLHFIEKKTFIAVDICK